VPSDPATESADLFDLQRGDANALNRLMSRWQRPLLSFAYRYVQNSADAQDLAAEAFVRLYLGRGRLRPDTNLPAWLFTTLTNLCRNHHRWKRRHPSVSLSAPSDAGTGTRGDPTIDPATSEASPDTALLRDEALGALREAIDALPHDLKVSVLLHHYEHLSYREIAAITHCSERGVETRLYRARQHLRKSLAGHIAEAPIPGA
jgi:RNA polymerase sigma-70 factor (ECF subfamily)